MTGRGMKKGLTKLNHELITVSFLAIALFPADD